MGSQYETLAYNFEMTRFLENLWIPGLNGNLRIYDGLSGFTRTEFTKGNNTYDRNSI